MTITRYPFVFVTSIIFLTACAFVSHARADTSATIFAYFQVGQDEDPAGNLRIDQFSAQVKALQADHFPVLAVTDIVHGLADKHDLPDRAIGLTFDDAYRSVMQNALPQLKEAKLTATIFVNPKLVDRGGNYMSWDEVRAARHDGFDIGAKIDPDDIDDNAPTKTLSAVNDAMTRIRDQTGVTPALFAYAEGIADKKLRDIVQSRGFVGAFALQSGPVSVQSDLYFLPRFPMTEAFGTLDRFRIAANSLPLKTEDVLPEDESIIRGANPPQIGFTVLSDDVSLANLACFIEDEGKAPLQIIGSRVEVRPAEAFDEDDTTRINCTVPAGGAAAGRWRWLGFNFYVLPS